MGNYDEQIKELNNFLLDISCLDTLKKHCNKVNIFKILKTNSYEIRHSNFLSWLLNPYESHNLNDTFLRMFIAEFLKENNYDLKTINKWLLLDLSNAEVSREAWYKDKKDYLDIVIKFEKDKKIIAIENKVFAKENKNKGGKSQTAIYKEKLEEAFDGYEFLFIYLTPFGDLPDDTNWGTMTYSQIKNIVRQVADNYVDDNYTKQILENYIELLGDEIVGNDELVRICDEIYKKHKNALDIIFENKTDGAAVVANFLKDILTDISKDTNSNIIYNDDFNTGVTFIRFTTKNLNKILGEYPQGIDGVWQNQPRTRYFYEFWVRGLKTDATTDLRLDLVLSGTNFNQLPQVQQDATKNIYRTLTGKNYKNTKTAHTIHEVILKNAVQVVVENEENKNFKDDIKKKIIDKVAEIEKTL